MQKNTDTVQPGSRSLIMIFFYWYFIYQPKNILISYFKMALAWEEILSVLYLIKTLFSPWKSIINQTEVRGLNLKLIGAIIIDNAISRSIGMLVRLITIVISLIVQVLILSWLIIYLSLWLFLPLALIFLIYLIAK